MAANNEFKMTADQYNEVKANLDAAKKGYNRAVNRLSLAIEQGESDSIEGLTTEVNNFAQQVSTLRATCEQLTLKLRLKSRISYRALHGELVK